MIVKNLLILGAGNNGAIEKFYSAGLEKCGISVQTYIIADQYYAAINKNIINKVLNKISADIFYKGINDRLLVFLKNKTFDVILVFKGMELFPGTVEHLHNHATVVANYNGDHPFTYYFPGSGNKNVLNSIKHFDVHFSYAGSIVEQLKQKFRVSAFCVPFGYNSNSATSLPIVDSVYNDRFLFIGAYDHERAVYLNQLKSDHLDIYGENKWRTRNYLKPYLIRAYKNRPLYGKDYVIAIRNATGIINLLRKQNVNEGSHNMRTFEVPGYGGLLVSERTHEQLSFFEDGKEAIFFDSIHELGEKLLYLSKNLHVVQSIKRAAFKRCLQSDYSYDNRSRQLIHLIECNF
ncbi:MAG: glycosyltransferase [Chitinophagaceae bacterium]